ncbi:uncharacterized protein LOC127859404 isoform X2 [Dreissena polymorpha]|uniref:uncharacterized protein LOC127859404 isoform X2 n=1 Tax=Dreissena polymorpha TaxID=45954 RepID=UPI002265210D|nr:uncharacterized protein LOC127859404 isoform X2 [Dreissena polymorpha]
MADLVENRSASWQPRELEELLEGVQQNYEVLWGKLSGTLSKKDKDRAWSDIVQSINSVGGNERNVEDSMKKWCDWKFQVSLFPFKQAPKALPASLPATATGRQV